MKYAICLIGAASAALTPLPMDSTAFPVYATAVAPTSSEKEAVGDGVKVDYVQVSGTTVGTVGAYRNGLYILPLQKITKNVGSAGDSSFAIDMDVAGSSFWVIDLAGIGAYIAPNTGANDADKTSGQDGGAANKFVVCESIADINKCNGRMFNTNNAGTAGKADSLKDRWIKLKTVAKANTLVWTGTVEQYSYQFQFNEDLGIAAQYQSSWTSSTAVVDGTRWCSEWKHTLLAAGTTHDFRTVNGYGPKTKCNFMMASENATVGPTIKVKTMANATFLFQWIEFLNISDLGSDGVMASTQDDASFRQGAYTASATAGPFLNPWTTVKWWDADSTNMFSSTEWMYSRVPQNYAAGSVGNLRYHTTQPGDFSEYTTVTGDIGIFWAAQNLKNAEYTSFTTRKNTFETDKTNYETKWDEREAQKVSDPFGFEAKVVIPARPERPTRPAAYAGPVPDLAAYVGSGAHTWNVLAASNNGKAALAAGPMFDSAPAVRSAFANRIGYLVASTTTSVENTGHVFGRLGQGDITMPSSSPYYWGAVTSTQAHMLIGIYPGNSSDTGLTGTSEIVIEAAAKTYESDLYINKVPSLPADASAQAKDLGAKALGASIAAAAVIAASLY